MNIIELNNSSKHKIKYNKSSLMMFALVLIGLMVIFSYGVGNVSAASTNVYVNSTGSDAYDGTSPVHTTGNIGPVADINIGISDVSTGGTVNIANGLYTDSGITITRNMNLKGQSKTGTIINAAKTNQILVIQSGVTVSISNLTFSEGQINSVGSGINNKGTLTVTDSNFIGNTGSGSGSGSGGAIANSGTLTVINTAFTGNTANGNGGAIYNTGSMTVTNSNFNSNYATSAGGAIDSHGISLEVTGSSFTYNIAGDTTSYGGGAIFADSGTLNVADSTFTGNNANYNGGAIYVGNNTVVTGSTFTGNTALNNGGAIYNTGTTSCTVNNNILNSNSARNNGGAIDNQGPLNVNGNMFTNNVAYYYGGAISNELAANVVAAENNFVSNNAWYGGAIYNIGTANIQFSRIFGNTANTVNAIENSGTITSDSNNWWGSNSGPASGDVNGATVPSWLVLTVLANPTSIGNNGHSTISAYLMQDSTGAVHTGEYVPNGIPIYFTSSFGTISQASTVNGVATSTFTSGVTAGIVTINAYLDNQALSTSVTVKDTIPPKVSKTNPTNGKTGFSKTSTISIKFSENIKSSTYYKNIKVKNTTTGKYVSFSKSISGTTLNIKTSSTRRGHNWYEIIIPKAAIKDLAGNNLTATYTFKFKTKS